MKPELWGEVERLYHAALERPLEEREAFLDAACAGGEEIRREVDALLDYDQRASQFIESPAIEVVAKRVAAETIPEDPAKSFMGRKVGAFELIAPLGKGGMSEVYLTLDPRLGRKVAVKILSPEFTGNPERIHRLEQEARSLSALNHPNIITIHEIGHESGEHYIVEEFVDGWTLRQLMTEAPSTRMTLAQTVDIAVQIADALAVAHEAGITHRDIKPENVMVRPDGIVKVLDFGLAKLTVQPRTEVDAEAATVPKVTTNPGLVMGTPRYMSPEQARGQKVDARTDIFSFGVVLYEMIAGRPPFDGVNTLDVIGAILNQEPQPLAPLTPDAPREPEELERIVFKCLDKDRDARYPSARTLTNDLHRLKELIGSQSIAPARSLSKTGSTPRRLMVALAASIVLIAAFGYAVFSRRTPGEQDQIRSLAVLPLKAIAREDEQNYLGLGIADTIITKVSRIGGLVVRPTSAVRRYANQEIDALQAAREQRVDAVLDGTLQREGDRLRVSVNLLRTSDGVSLWSDQFDLSFTEIFGLQDKVARQVVERLHYRISAAEQARIAKQQTSNPRAYEHYVKAMYYFGDRKMFWWQRELTDKTVDLLRKAVELDPGYALARVMLAYAYAHTAIMHEDNPDLIGRANLELELAERLDPQLAEIYVVRSFILFSHYKGYQVDEPLAELRQAQQLDPNAGHFELAFIYAHLGLDRWQRELEQALEIEPTSEVIKDHIIRYYFIDTKLDEALAAVKRFSLSEQDPAYPMYLAFYYMGRRMQKEAAPFVEAVTKKNPDWYNFRGLSLALQGKFREAEATVNEDWEKKKIPPVYHPVYHHFTHNAARIYALEGKSEESLKWLRVTAWEGFPNYPLFLRDPYLDGIRNDPAFVQFMAEMKTRWENCRSRAALAPFAVLSESGLGSASKNGFEKRVAR